jgi:hypothetical protein
VKSPDANLPVARTETFKFENRDAVLKAIINKKVFLVNTSPRNSTDRK